MGDPPDYFSLIYPLLVREWLGKKAIEMEED